MEQQDEIYQLAERIREIVVTDARGGHMSLYSARTILQAVGAIQRTKRYGG